MATNKRNYGLFYGLLRLQAGFSPQYQILLKESIINNFSQRVRGIRDCSLSNLTDAEYNQLIEEMKRDAVTTQETAKQTATQMRKAWISKIFRKLGEMGVSTENGFDEVNAHIKRLKGFGGRIIPEYKTEELEGLFKAVCNYVDGYREFQKKQNKRLSY